MLTTRTGHAQEIFRYGYYVVCKAAERRLGMSAGIAALAQRTKARFDATFREKRLLKGPRPVRGLPATDPVARLHGGRAVT